MRSLPVSVHLYPNESPVSFFSRLCTANRVSEHDVWRAMRQEDPLLGPGIAPNTALEAVCELAGLPPRAFVDNGHRYASTCRHDPTLWVRSCPYCNGAAPGLMTLCRRCTQGELVFVERLSGPVCLRHGRWHANGLDLDVSDIDGLVGAQRRLNGNLHASSIGYRTTIAAIARDLMNGWWHPARGSAETMDLDDQWASLPGLIELILALASPRMFEVLDDAKLANRIVAALLLRLGAEARTNGDLRSTIAQVPRDRADDDTDVPEALLKRMKTIRAGLLRHMNTRIDRWPNFRGTSHAGRPVRFVPPEYRASLR